MKLVLRITGILILIVLVGAFVFAFTKTPQSDRDWSEEFSQTSSANITVDGKIHITNVRDWTYDEGITISKDWREVTIDPTTIKRVWFVTEPFSSWTAVGHTFLSFEFSDGTVLSFSIEARREVGEKYSALRGLFNTYELAYQWGTERDFVTRRLLYLNHPVRRYPLTLDHDMAEGLFRGAVERTNALAEKPRFYNTFTENCTNALAYIVNGIAPHTLPYDLSWQLTGYADLYLMKQGFIELTDNSQDATRDAHDLTKWKTEIQAATTMQAKEFSALLNTKLE